MAFIGAAIAAAGGIAGAVISSNASASAAQKQQQAADQALAFQKQTYEDQQKRLQPWMQAGTTALSQMQDPSFQKGFTAADFQADPGYAFRLQQGQQALQRSAAARGGLQSGATMKGLGDYSQGMASQEYQNAYNRFTNDQNNRFGRLSTLAGYGQNANSQGNASSQNFADNSSGITMQNGQAQGAAAQQQGQAWASTLSNIGQGFGKAFQVGGQMPSGGGGSAMSSAPGGASSFTPSSIASPGGYSLGAVF